MSAAAGDVTSTQRTGWVAFSDDPSWSNMEFQKDGNCNLQKSFTALPQEEVSPPLGPASRGETGALSQQNAWVHFDEKSWRSPSPSQSQVKGPRHSVCSSASFWSIAPPSESSWTGQSEEHSSLSMGESSCDLPSLPIEDPANQTPSSVSSPNCSIYQDDDSVDMDSVNWLPSAKHMNGQSDTSTGRFSSWVTFDDDEPNFQCPGRVSSLKLENLSCGSTQDANSNMIISPVQNQRVERHLLDLTPDCVNPAFTLDSSLLSTNTPYNKKNPFLDEELVNVQPSPINPFSAYFDEKQMTVSQSNGSSSESPHIFSFSSPFFKSDVPDVKRESLLLFSPVSSSVDDNVFCPPKDRLEQLKSLQISDPDQLGSPTLPDDLPDSEEPEEPPYQPAYLNPQDGWPMMLRIPEKKNIMSSRHWGPIFVKLTDSGRLQLFYEKGLEKPFKEFQLDGRHELSEHKLQNYDENGRVHTISIDHVVYKEKRKIQPKVAVVHMPIKEQLVKLGTIHYQDFLSFTAMLQEKLMRLPVSSRPASNPGSYSEEEVVVDVRDEFHGVVSKGDNRILQQLVVTHVNVLPFVSGSPLCKIGLNDIQVKGNEVVSRHDIIPNTTTRWIKLWDCQLHGYADKKEFAESRAIAFSPPGGRRFELLRFRTVFAEKTLPFTVRTVASVKGAEVELQSWLVMSTGFSSNRDPLTLIPCENVMIRFPIPLMWAKNFRRDSVTGEKSLKARFNKGASFGSASTSGSEPAMRVTLGTAKYEHAFKSVVWRINRLPDKNAALGHPHTFFCRLELGSDRDVPPKFHRHLEVEFDMPAASASKATVRSLSVGERTDVKKWINYKSHYSYQARS
ncbi:stonin-2 isoform X2 [Conger conger]|uniref:stonin-2 isoform X2 n=1 Tax=Conger conger TaxID=82655 RepID=UPI002A5A8337|nr:stonin-2 isoform X2 [Conger conger]